MNDVESMLFEIKLAKRKLKEAETSISSAKNSLDEYEERLFTLKSQNEDQAYYDQDSGEVIPKISSIK